MVLQRDELLATIDKELGNGGSSSQAVVLTVIRLDDEDDGAEKVVAATVPPSPEATAPEVEHQEESGADDDEDSTATAEDDKGAAAPGAAAGGNDATLLDETRVEEESGFFDAPAEEGSPEAAEEAIRGGAAAAADASSVVPTPASPAMGGPPVGGAALSLSDVDTNALAAPGSNEKGEGLSIAGPVEPEETEFVEQEGMLSRQAPSKTVAAKDNGESPEDSAPPLLPATAGAASGASDASAAAPSAPPAGGGGADLLAYYGVERRPTEDDDDDDDDDLSTTGGGLGNGSNPLLDASDATIDGSMVIASEENTSLHGNSGSGNSSGSGSGSATSSSRVCLACTFVIESPNALNCEMCGAALPPPPAVVDTLASPSQSAAPLVAGALSDADAALFESSSSRPPAVGAARSPGSPSINWDDPDDLSGTAAAAAAGAPAAVDSAGAATATNLLDANSSSSNGNGATMMSTPERPRRAPGQLQPYVDTYDGPPETPEEKASRVKKERASAAEARMAARKKAYQDALYAEIPTTTTPLGMSPPPLLLPTDEGNGNGGGEGNSSSSHGEASYEEEALTQHLQQLIPVMNKLQDVFVKLEAARSLHQVASDRDSSSRNHHNTKHGRSRRRQRPRGGDGDEEYDDGVGNKAGGEGAATDSNSKNATSGLDLPQIVMLGAQSSGTHACAQLCAYCDSALLVNSNF